MNDDTQKLFDALEKLAHEVQAIRGETRPPERSAVVPGAAVAHDPKPVQATDGHPASIWELLQMEERLTAFARSRAEALKAEASAQASRTIPLRPFSPYVRWYTVAFAGVGFTTGLFAGMSQSPVIGAMLPLLFGLVGGAGGLYLAQLKLEEKLALERLRLIGVGLVLFVSATLLGSAWGISRRTGASLVDFVRLGRAEPTKPATLGDVSARSLDRNLATLMLRTRIQALGATSAEQQSILDSAAAEDLQKPDAPVPATITPLLRAFARELEASAGALEQFASQDTASADDLKLAGAQARAWAHDMNDWADRIEKNQTVPPSFLSARLSEVATELNGWLQGNRGTVAVSLLKGYEARKALWSASLALAPLRAAVPTTSSDDVRSQVQKDADRLISILRSQNDAHVSAKPALFFALDKPSPPALDLGTFHEDG